MNNDKLSQEFVQSIIYQAIDLSNSRQVREFSVPPSTLMGPGSISQAGDALKKRGIKNVFLMVDGTLLSAGGIEIIERSLNRVDIDYSIWRCPPGEPVDDDIFNTVDSLLKVQCDAVVAVGGGSVLDAAKAVAVLATNKTLILTDLKPDIALQPRLPFIAVPTTAGTGSEATNVSVITCKKNHTKEVLAHNQLLPDIAIIDACLTLGVPAHVTAMTGIDAFTHAVEAYVACNATSLTRALALRAITLIGRSLPVAVGKGSDVPAREAMMLASYMAGIAFSNAGLGLCHAMSHQIGAAYHIPHGKANAILLPAVMKFNKLVCKDEFSEIGHALTQRQIDSEETISVVERLIEEIDLFEKLASYGGKSEDYPELAKAALHDFCLAGNPRTVTEAQIVKIYESV